MGYNFLICALQAVVTMAPFVSGNLSDWFLLPVDDLIHTLSTGFLFVSNVAE